MGEIPPEATWLLDGHCHDKDSDESWDMHRCYDPKETYCGHYFTVDIGDGLDMRVCEEFIEPREIGFTKMWTYLEGRQGMLLIHRKYRPHHHKTGRFTTTVEIVGSRRQGRGANLTLLTPKKAAEMDGQGLKGVDAL